jgi:phage/plasmid-like protein (TIGR03299 family)
MAHNITDRDSMMYVGETPWHGLGKAIPVGTALTAYDAMVAAGLDWDVYQKPLHWKGSDGTDHVVQDSVINCRRILVDNKEVEEELGVVGTRYEVVQNAAAFDWFNPFIESKEAAFHTAGSLKGGKIVWVLAELNRDPMQIRAGDMVRKFLLLSHSHDGSRALRVGFTPIRVVCWNTLSMATSNAKGNAMLRLKHTAKILDTLALVRDTINTVDQQFEATAAQFRKLASRAICRKDLEKYVTLVMCSGSTNADPEELSTKMKNIVGGVLDSLPKMKGGYDGTAWGAYNLVTEYLTWDRGRSDDASKAADTRLSDLWLGGMGGKMNETALKLALDMAA